MIPSEINVTVREVHLLIEQYGWNIRIDHRKERTVADVMAVLGRWLDRWARRRNKWLINECRLKWNRDPVTDEMVTYLKWAACDAPPGQPAGKRWKAPPHQRVITFWTLEQ